MLRADKMQNGHALLSPSSAHRWLVCPGSVTFCKDLPDTAGEDAAEGTAAHTLAQKCLEQHKDAVEFIGESITVNLNTDNAKVFEVTEDMAAYVQVYLNYIDRETSRFHAMYEQKLPLAPITGEENSEGTADAVIFRDEELVIVDLKYGRGVKVYAEDNEQLKLYAAAAREEYSAIGDFTKFKLVIVQPRLDHIDEWSLGVADLDTFCTTVGLIAPLALSGEGELVPSEDGCRFCKGKATCPALTEQVLAVAKDGFDDLSKMPPADLGISMAAVGMVEDWCRAVRAEVERRLIQGMKVVGWKLVGGRKGARDWADEKEVETAMKSMKLSPEEMYKFKLITPTQAEKLFKDNPDKWNTLQAYITQAEGKPSVAPSTDPRPEVGGAMEHFEVLA